MKKTIAQNLVNPLLIIGIAVMFRFIPHPPNVAPIAALALLGGTYLDKKYALIVPLVAMMISDIFLGFHNTMVFVYGSFLLTGVIGLWLKDHKTPLAIIGASLISSMLFFIITNFGVWAMGSMYPKTLVGLFQAYVMGLPFFRNTLIGDLFFTGLFFSSVAVIHHIVFTRQKTRVMQSKAPKSV